MQASELINGQPKTDNPLENVSKSISLISSHNDVFENIEDQYMSLTIESYDDKEGFETVKNARIHIKTELSTLEGERLDIKRQMVNLIDGTAKTIKERGSKILSYLKEKEDWYIAEVNRKKEERAEAKRKKEEEERLKAISRVDQMRAYGHDMDIHDAGFISDEDFETELQEAKADFESKEAARLEAERLEIERIAEEKRLEEERQEELIAEQARIKKENEIEAERLRIERAEAEAEALKLQKEREAFEAEKKAIADAKAEEERLAQLKIQEEAEAKLLEAERLENERLQAEELQKNEARQLRLNEDKISLTASVNRIGAPLMNVHQPETTALSLEIIQAIEDLKKSFISKIESL